MCHVCFKQQRCCDLNATEGERGSAKMLLISPSMPKLGTNISAYKPNNVTTRQIITAKHWLCKVLLCIVTLWCKVEEDRTGLTITKRSNYSAYVESLESLSLTAG